MKKEDIEQLVTEELEKYDMELPNYEYDTVAENIAERIANLCNLPVVIESVCYSAACGNNENNKCKHGDYSCSARQTVL